MPRERAPGLARDAGRNGRQARSRPLTRRLVRRPPWRWLGHDLLAPIGAGARRGAAM